MIYCMMASTQDNNLLGLGRFRKFKTPTPNLTPEVGVVIPELTPGGCVIFMIIFMIYIIGFVTSSFHATHHVSHTIYLENHTTS